ncbi:LuxR C-terminal-related transcriptional regulator [Caldalkalibacillus mannanilyticus]|uniref:LuxR C-terminal-related transcriptional regulator n=1 Tax=Caldalkalibacillus mannanilyticus TaxID=1418 RepID=UPI0004695C90|nr:LuxR C-terminal-related transcriptional regulator [Caldalkalibacillus mannanilyticus]
MKIPILSTKLYIAPTRSVIVSRPRLIERLNKDLHRKLTLISASAGSGKTTLVSQWIAECEHPVAWLSLDQGDNDPARFLTYFVAALQTIEENTGVNLTGMLQSPQPPSIESIITSLLNELSMIPYHFFLVLDDYHVINAEPVHHALTFLLEHMPLRMHLVIVTREDPPLPLARLRVRDQLNELRMSDLRFTLPEVTCFLNQVMDLPLSSKEIAALENRTEGWIAGLQLAAISMHSMQGQKRDQCFDSFIHSFTGRHHYVLDYLVEEVLHQQPEPVQSFLLQTSILDRLHGSLCDAILYQEREDRENEEKSVSAPWMSGQETLEYLERLNLFIVPLDKERRWYRYHHLFADLLRHQLQQRSASLLREQERGIAELHLRASTWFENNGLEMEAFHHATAAHDIERATRLLEGGGTPLHFRGAVYPVLRWLESLPPIILDAKPALWVAYASVLLFASQLSGVEQKLQAAEAALEGTKLDEPTSDLIGHIAAIRATVAVSQHQAEMIQTQSHRALKYLHPNNLPVRTATTWTLGYAYHLQGKRAEASQAYTEAISISREIGHFIITIMATIGLGGIQEMENKLDLAEQTYQEVLQLAGDPPLPVACEAHLGLARIYYQRNNLAAAQRHGQLSLQLSKQIEHSDRSSAGEIFLARLKLTQGDLSGAMSFIARADQFVNQYQFKYLLPGVVETQVLILLRQGSLEEALRLAQTHQLLLSEARVYLAMGDPATAYRILEAWHSHVETERWEDERLKVIILQALALHAQEEKEKEKAVQRLKEALRMAESGGFIRIFVDEGLPMMQLLSEAKAEGELPSYANTLLAAIEAEKQQEEATLDVRAVRNKSIAPPFIEPLSERELEVLQLIAQGLSNREIGERLFLALSTVKGHIRNIFDKLQVQRRTEAVARAREWGLL